MQETIERPETGQTAQAPQRVSIYQPTQSGLIFPEIPVFANHAQERQHRKEHLVAACRAFALQGFDYGFAGHLTVRDPEFPELYWTNPMCVHFSNVRLSNLILVDHKGTVVEGRLRRQPRRASCCMPRCTRRIPRSSRCHAHTVYGTAFASLGRPLEPITQDAAAFYGDHSVIRNKAGQVAVEEEAGRSASDYFKGVKAVIHQNHGLFSSQHPQHRLGRLLVHRPRAPPPAAADGRGHWPQAAPRLRTKARATAASMSAATTSAGCTSRPSTTS